MGLLDASGPQTVSWAATKALHKRGLISPACTSKIGRAPAKTVGIFRLEAAKRLLEDSGSHVDQIAVACGFGDEERMRVTFQRNLGVAPRDYRKRFSR